MDENDLGDNVLTLVDQLKAQNKENRQIMKSENFELNKAELEQFIVNNSGKLIKDCLSILQDVGPLVQAAPDGETMEGLASLIKASTSAMETLNKIALQDKKTATAIALKKMDIESKNIEGEGRQQLTRDQVMDMIISNATDVTEVDAEVDAVKD